MALFTNSHFLLHGVDIVTVLSGIKLMLHSSLKQNWADSLHGGGSDGILQLEFPSCLLGLLNGFSLGIACCLLVLLGLGTGWLCRWLWLAPVVL